MDNKKLQEFLQKVKAQSNNTGAQLLSDDNECELSMNDLGDKNVEVIIANAKRFRENCDIQKYYIKVFSSNEDEIEDEDCISIGETCVFGICDYVSLIGLFGFTESEVSVCKLYLMGRTKMFHGYSVNNFEYMSNAPFREQEGFDYVIDLKDLYKEFGSADFRLESNNTYESIVLRFTRLQINDQTFDIGPFVDLESTQDNWEDESDVKNVKQFQLADFAEAYADLNDGKVISSFNSFKLDDFDIPIEISHYHSEASVDKCFGANWRMNLNMQLIPNGSDKFTFVDAAGEKHSFRERYYYTEDEKKVFISKSEVCIDLNGNLTCGEREVKKLQSCGSYTLVPEIKDFNGAELIDGRQREQAELEDYVKSYERSLSDYVKASKITGEIVNKISVLNQEGLNELLEGVTVSSNSCVMTESAALQLQSLCANEDQLKKQKSQLENQTKQLDLQKEQINFQKSQLVFQSKQTEQQKSDLEHSELFSKKLYSNEIYENANFMMQTAEEFCNGITLSDENANRAEEIAKAREKMSYKSAVNNIKLIDASKEYTEQQSAMLDKQLIFLEDQYKTLQTQAITLDTQIAYVKKQKDYLISQSRKNLETVKEAFTKYFAKSAELDLLLMQSPVNYLKDENGIVSGFNNYGDLCCIFDSYGNSVAIEFDSLSRRISSVYDSKGKAMRFKYTDGLLESITDNRGRCVSYGYSEGNLTSVKFVDGTSAEFGYSDGLITSVMSSNGISSLLQYDEESKKLICLNTLSKIFTIQKHFENCKDLPYSEQLFSVAIEYGDNKAKLVYHENESEYYLFYNSKRIRNYIKTDKTGLKTEQDHIYTMTPVKTAIQWTGSTVEDRKISLTEYDGCDMTITSWEATPLSLVKTRTFYSYNDDNKLVKKTANEITYSNGEISTSARVTKYAYNAQGSLILTENYIEGEELTSGINYEERNYDDNGNIVKTVCWNSLDASSKFYTQNDRAENGQISADRNETGEISAEYEYLDGTKVVNSVKQANGSKIAYGRNPYNYAITSVTQSTEDGDANTTDIICEHGLPVEVKCGNTIIEYVYDFKGRKTNVSVNGSQQISASYVDYSVNEDKSECVFETQTSTHYVGSEESVTVSTQKKGILDESTNIFKVTEEIKINNADVLCKNYDVKERLTDICDYASQTFTEYTYNGYNNLIKVEAAKNSMVCYTENLTYNDVGALSEKDIAAEGKQWNYSYSYKNNAARSLASISFRDYSFKPLTDVNGRNTGREVYNGTNKVAAEYISYKKVGDHATNTPVTVWFGSESSIKDSIKYKYDKCGNICEIKENGHVAAKYTYDSLSRLVREDNRHTGKTVVYSYDQNGNITERCEYAYTAKTYEELSELECTHFSYDYNGDKLVSYNDEAFTYNNLGCPTTYRGNPLTWQYGKRLIDFNGTSFVYDGQGRRISKGTTNFVYDANGNLIYQSNGLQFIYDHSGAAGLIYDNKTYLYRKDVQGNIVAILDEKGAVVVKYTYDAWGNHAIVDENGIEIDYRDKNHIGNLNPFRYRGYYYDVETGLYYLQTRYYDPEIGRFISQDSIEFADPERINGLNLYAYCSNNPVMGYDPTGTTEWWEWLLFGLACVVILIAGAVGAFATGGASLAGSIIAIGGLASMIGNIVEQTVTVGFDNIRVGEVGIQSLSGSLYGLAATMPGLAGVIVRAGGSSLANMAMTLYDSNGEADTVDVLKSGAAGLFISLGFQLLGKAGGVIAQKLSPNKIKIHNINFKYLQVGAIKFLSNLAKGFTGLLGGFLSENLSKYLGDFLGSLFD